MIQNVAQTESICLDTIVSFIRLKVNRFNQIYIASVVPGADPEEIIPHH